METNQTSIELTTQQTPKIVSDDAGGEYLFVLPVIVIVGLCGNIASIVTILNTRLRKVGILNRVNQLYWIHLLIKEARFDRPTPMPRCIVSFPLSLSKEE